ncbi:hypothetical protein KSP40_PGU002803 [Platanthera guangdongensis]|uniref:Uncharacterized protein n=1 Tax=Platanthera guangdongensis TaxID=2320717 RepID=A0ABR2M8Z3_9ASPA
MELPSAIGDPTGNLPPGFASTISDAAGSRLLQRSSEPAGQRPSYDVLGVLDCLYILISTSSSAQI